MRDSMIRSRIDPVAKQQAVAVLNKMGVSLSEAIRLFIHQLIIKQAIPFAIKVPNAKTLAAMKSVEAGEYEAVSLEDLKAQWESL